MWMRWRWHFCRHWPQSHLRCHFHCCHWANQIMANSLLRSPYRLTLLNVCHMHCGSNFVQPLAVPVTLSAAQLCCYQIVYCQLGFCLFPPTRTYAKIFLKFVSSDGRIVFIFLTRASYFTFNRLHIHMNRYIFNRTQTRPRTRTFICTYTVDMFHSRSHIVDLLATKISIWMCIFYLFYVD